LTWCFVADSINSLVDDDDAATITAPNTSSSACSESGTLLNEVPTRRRVTLPSWFLGHKEKRDVSTSLAEPNAPTSPTLSDCSEDSATPLYPRAPDKVRSLSQCSSVSRSHVPLIGLPISCPVMSSSSIDATIRSSVADSLQYDTSITPQKPAVQSIKSKSWPSRHRRLASLGEEEKPNAEIPDPKSEFSDSEDDEQPRTEKTFRRRLSETFGTCFIGRKDQLR